MQNFRIEIDTMGEVKVPASAYYMAQTQRSVENFPICNKNPGHKMPKEMVFSLLLLKKAVAITNKQLKIANPNDGELAKITPEICDKIICAVNIITGVFDKIEPVEQFYSFKFFHEILIKERFLSDEIIKEQTDATKKIREINKIPAHQNIFDWFYETQFPLIIWQTGSGTQSNMNVNEVIASVANELENGEKGGKNPVHPNDHVNLGQSSNDVFPTGMHIATTLLLYQKLIPTLIRFSNELRNKEEEFEKIVKIGRTHTQDATPVTLGQEFSGYKAQIKHSLFNVCFVLEFIEKLAQGGTAVGTGINCPEGFAKKFAENLTIITGLDRKYKSLIEVKIAACDSTMMREMMNSKAFAKGLNCSGKFQSERNKFFSLACNDDLLQLHNSLSGLATSLNKIANDIRFLASGPRSGLGEISLPENEPGSSIMPGKVNPTQCEALSMIACQVMGNNIAITTGNMQGHFELNVFRPMIIKNVVESINILSDGINSFIDKCLLGITPNRERIKQLLENSLMLVTALNPYIGYETAAKIAKNAHSKNLTLKESAKALGILTQTQEDGKILESQWDEIMNPEKMV